MITSGLVALRPSRDSQSLHRAPATKARQRLRDNLAPQFAQKFERLIVGVSEKQADYISKVAETTGHTEKPPKLKQKA
jgi:hypothetical protein